MKMKFTVTGMTCAACSARVEKVAGQVQGVSNVEVNLLAGTMTLDAEDQNIAKTVIAAVAQAGYGASEYEKKSTQVLDADDALSKMKTRILISAVFLVVLMYFNMGHMIGLPVPGWYHQKENALIAILLQLFLTLPVVFLNRSYYSRGLKSLWHRSPNMDTLIAVGSGAALIYGVAALFRMSYGLGHGHWDVVLHYRDNLYFESAAMILTLITLGKFLETRAKGKTGDAIRQLMQLRPETATILQNGQEVVAPIENVSVGDIVVVRSGGSIPVDGTVISGRAAIDQSALTGESVPLEVNIGDRVAAATVVTEGYVQIRADKVGQDTTLSQVVLMVEQASSSKAPIARLADKIAGIFVPVVMGIALLAFAIWMFVDRNLEFALNVAISVLVISCPCALGLATPVAIMVGTGRGAQMGVLFKTSRALENLHKVDTVVLDKTGTLTKGKPAVTDIVPHNITKQKLLQIAASLEKGSEHPFAKAILAKADGLVLSDVSGFQTLPGQGVCATLEGITYYGGNMALMMQLGVNVPQYDDLSAQGKTPLYFASADQNYLGMIAAADVLKEDSAAAVEAMKKLDLDVVMLTGDNKQTAESIAASAGISHVISDVLPDQKANVVQNLRSQGHQVLMVGDGINDAPALVCADVGMAIGAGTDIAVESADVVLMNSSLMGVSNAVALSKATIRNIRQNLFWAFFYNSLGIPVAAGVLYPVFGLLLSPMLGAAAMSMSSVFVVTNALRLRFWKPGCEPVAQPKVPIIQEEVKMEIVIGVAGMMCPHCKANVEKACKAVAGTEDAVVDLQAKTVTVKGSADVNALKSAIIEAGYEIIE